MLSGASFVFGGRTGGLNENQWIDNLSITTFTLPNVGISRQPGNLTVLLGQPAVFSVGLNNTNGATFQWFKNNVAIPGATEESFTIPAVTAADSGAFYKLTITGRNNTVTTDEVTLSVREISLPGTSKINFDFNNGQTPAGMILFGGADRRAERQSMGRQLENRHKPDGGRPANHHAAGHANGSGEQPGDVERRAQ